MDKGLESMLLYTAGISLLFGLIAGPKDKSDPNENVPNPIVTTVPENTISMFFTSSAQCVNEESIGEITQKAQDQIRKTGENVYVEVVKNEDGNCDYLFSTQPSAPDNSLQ